MLEEDIRFNISRFFLINDANILLLLELVISQSIIYISWIEKIKYDPSRTLELNSLLAQSFIVKA